MFNVCIFNGIIGKNPKMHAQCASNVREAKFSENIQALHVNTNDTDNSIQPVQSINQSINHEFLEWPKYLKGLSI